MARDYKRLTRRARHLIRRLRRTKHAAVQRVTVHELGNEIHRRRFGRAAKTAAPSLGRAGQWRPLSYRAKKLLTQLRKTKVWSVQRRLVKELGEEIERSRRTLAERARRARQRWRKRGQRFRKSVQRGHERHLARAERRQREPAGDTLRRGLHRGRQAHGASARAHRRRGNRKARLEVPGVFARFAARRGWTRLQPDHHWTPAARRAEARAKRPTPGRPAQVPAPRGRLAPATAPAPRTRPAPARTR